MKKDHLKFVIDSRCFRGSCVTSMSDGIHCDYYGSTLEELKKQENNPFLVAVTRNAIHKRSRIHDKSLCRPFREITEENYYNCMNELPPVRLKRHSFFFGEPYHGSLYMFCFTIGKRFFRGLRPVMTPQAELERQMNEHYRNITFKGKVSKGKTERITSKDKQEIITIPYSFTDKENRERFICNMVTGGNDGGDTCKARKDMANILLSLRKHHFLYFSGYGRHDDMETLLDEVEEKRYTIITSGCLFQFPPCRDSVSFTGTPSRKPEKTSSTGFMTGNCSCTLCTDSEPSKERKHQLKQKQSSLNANAMNNTESWKKYVPETVSLYHVDYRENLGKREDLQEQCIQNNNMGRLYETVMECYAEQEAESLLKILEEIKEKMAEEKRQEEFEEHREEITDLILSRSDTDPAEELIKNSAAVNMYYSPGTKIEERIGKESRTIRFHGDVIVAVANSFNGSGYHISLPLDITFPFVRDRLFVDSQVRYSYAIEVCGMCRDWCDSTSWETEYKTARNTGRNRQKEKTLSTN